MNIKELDKKVDIYRYKVELASASTTDADALECIELFPIWIEGRGVIVGERLQYNKVLYKCLQEHITQADWTPDITPALWQKVSVEEFPEWSQPQGAADAYALGDKVSYKDNHYISTIDYNVWAPDVYGWELIVGEGGLTDE